MKDYVIKYFGRPIYKGDGIELNNSSDLPSNVIFLPNTLIPNSNQVDEIKQILKKHHQNINLIKLLFNSSSNNSEDIIRKFEVFKLLDLPIIEFNNIRSFRGLLNLFYNSKNNSIVDFRNLDNLSYQGECLFIDSGFYKN